MSAFWIFAMCISTIAWTQDNSETWDPKPTDWKNNRWSWQLSFGLNSFQTRGIPMSRNQINYTAANPENQFHYKQESRTAGICYEGALDYQLFQKAKLGLVINMFKDDDEYLFSDGKNFAAHQIEADSMDKMTIRNLQSYLNLGLRYEHILYASSSSRHRFFAGVTCGWSFNRTPDRSEYDYYDPEHFIAADTVATDVWRITQTRFRDGFSVAPTMGYANCFKENRSLRISISQIFQWHSTEQELHILGKNSIGSRGAQAYTLRAFQLKIGYTF